MLQTSHPDTHCTETNLISHLSDKEIIMNRRQAIQTIGGGALAGFSAINAKAGIVQAGNTVSLKCLGQLNGRRYLDGRTGDGSVGLAPGLVKPYSGTKWKIYNSGGGSFALLCLGSNTGPRWLDGRTANGTVGLAPTTNKPYTGTRWLILPVQGGYTLKCLGDVEGPRWLDGRTENATVGLAKSTDPPFTGTRWEINIYPVCFDTPCPLP